MLSDTDGEAGARKESGSRNALDDQRRSLDRRHGATKREFDGATPPEDFAFGPTDMHCKPGPERKALGRPAEDDGDSAPRHLEAASTMNSLDIGA